MNRLLILLLLAAACTRTNSGSDSRPFVPASIETRGGSIHFQVRLDTASKRPAAVLNGPDTLYYDRLSRKGDSVLFHFDALDSYLITGADLKTGRYEKRGSKGRRISLPFGLSQAPALAQKSDSRFDGEWNVIFYESGGPSAATGVFSHDGGQLRGTFLTETGDYRFLSGETTPQGFRLWTFDIAHAYYFDAELLNDTTLQGRFWAYGDQPVDWTARRGAAPLRDPMSVTRAVAGARVSFAFPDQDGTQVSHTDAAFAGKPMLVYLFGSWCPNCADEARLLAELYPEYKKRGVEFVGLAFEYSGDAAEDQRMVRLYRQRFGVTWPTLLAGTSDKADATSRIPFVEKVVSFPTSFFVRKDGSIAAVHTGFSGPGTGAYHQLERQRFIHHLDELLR